jgi:hypothetical protein
MKVLRLLIMLCLLLTTFIAQSQRNFKSGNVNLQFPGPITIASSVGMFEGSGTIDDVSGNLLLQTNGFFLYNAAGTILATVGTASGISAAQSGIILLKPGSTTDYYIFTVEGWPGSGFGLGYSVWSTSSNTLTTPLSSLNGACIEQLTATCDGRGGYWIISHQKGVGSGTSNLYVAYNLTATGLNTTPVISKGIMKYPASGNNRYGCITISPDGKRMCSAFGGLPVTNNTTVETGFFNNATGVISSVVTLQQNSSTNPKKVLSAAYCGTFSPNSKLLYVTSVGGATSIKQFQLLPTLSTTIASRFDVFSSSNPNLPWALRLGPDGKMYGGVYNTTSIVSVNSPNLVGVACAYNPAAFPANTFLCNAMFSQVPPNCQPCNVQGTIDVSKFTICKGDSVILYSNGFGGAPPYSYQWTPSATINCPTCNITGAHPTATTTYQVVITDVLGCSTTKNITVTVDTTCCGTCTAPVNLTTTCGSGVQCGQTIFSWAPVTCALSYNLTYTDLNTGITTTINVSSGTSINIGLIPGHIIQWQVQTICNNGLVSGYSTVQTFTAINCGQFCRSASQAAATNVSVYPNPATNNVTITISSMVQGTQKVMLTDFSGRLLMQKNVQSAKGYHTVQFNVASLVAGVYLIQIPSKNGMIVKKLVKQ